MIERHTVSKINLQQQVTHLDKTHCPKVISQNDSYTLDFDFMFWDFIQIKTSVKNDYNYAFFSYFLITQGKI